MLFSYIIRLITSEEVFMYGKKEYLLFFFPLLIFNIFKQKKRFIETSSNKFRKLIFSRFRINSSKIRIYLILFLFFIIIIVVYITEINKGRIRKI